MVALPCHWLIDQLDVNNAFLNRDLIETMHMMPLPGFADSRFVTYVYQLQWALYSLKQSPQVLYIKLSSCLMRWGFQNPKANVSLFFRFSGSHVTLLLIYVDDILVTDSSIDLICSLMNDLNAKFSLKDLGDFTHFLGVQITSCGDNFYLQ